MAYTLGSLFDGSGGFPLAGSLCGIEPTWAAEVEPYPIAVTRSRFPSMKHLGSVTDVHGGEIEPVDIITFGSPCQDLSVAGKRAGLKHEANGDEETTRSGLFMEAVRIIKEMREATNGEYPSFALWENVPGAFSSNKGEDFRTVLAELIGIVEPNAAMPPVPKAGWAYADSYRGDGWSLAYRVFDAQYWGVPQRRRRIHLVLHLRGQRAGEVLFERQGVRGYFEACGTQGQGFAAHPQGSSAPDDREGTVPYMLKVRTGVAVDSAGKAAGKGALVQEDKAMTLATTQDPYLFQPVKEQHLFENHSQDARYKGPLDVSPMLPAQLGTGGNNQPFVVENGPVYCLQGNGIDRSDNAGCNGRGWREEACYTLNTLDRPAVAYCMGNGQLNQMSMAEQSNTLDCMHDKQAVVVAHGVDCRNLTETPELYQTLQAKPNGGQSLNYSGAVRVRYIVRRLTPTECARLQGFADRWGDIDEKSDFTEEEYQFWLNVRNTHATINGKQVKEYTKPQMVKWYNGLHTDSAEYKLWGNGIALPPALYCMQGMVEALNREEGDDWML